MASLLRVDDRKSPRYAPFVMTFLAVSLEISLPLASPRTAMSRSMTMPTSRSFSPTAIGGLRGGMLAVVAKAPKRA